MYVCMYLHTFIHGSFGICMYVRLIVCLHVYGLPDQIWNLQFKQPANIDILSNLAFISLKFWQHWCRYVHTYDHMYACICIQMYVRTYMHTYIHLYVKIGKHTKTNRDTFIIEIINYYKYVFIIVYISIYICMCMYVGLCM